MNSLKKYTFAIYALLFLLVGQPIHAQLFFNEIMASNSSSLADEFGEYDDWIEIYNAGTTDINLAGYYLSDNPLDPFALQIPTTNAAETTVSAGGFLILWADKDPEQGAHHLDFKLSSTGETIALYSPNQILLDELAFTEQNPDVSFGRVTDGSSDFQFFYSPTPNLSNSTLPPPSTFEVILNLAIASPNDDAEEYPNGNMLLDSGDLELGNDSSSEQTIGLRFGDVALPVGTTVNEAYLQFFTDEVSLGASNLIIEGELSADAVAYESEGNNITDRPKTNASVNWSPEEWLYVEQGDALQKSTNINEVLNEILTQPNWQEGNAMALILTGDGSRVAFSYDGDSLFAPRLEIKAEFLTPTTPALPLFINEIAANSSFYRDASGKQEDWIEIYNPNDEPVFIGGLYLSDDPAYPTKWQIGSPISIPAGGFEVIFADKDPEEGGLHTSFALDNDGESLILSQVINNQTITLDEVTFGAVPFLASYGRVTDGSDEFVLFGAPTPKASNNGALLYLEPPVFSVLSAVYQTEQNLDITHPSTGVDIYFTDNAGLPDDTDSPYNGTLTLDQTQVIRAIAYKDGYATSAVTSESYVFDFDATIPVFHIITDPDNFFDDEIGIYVEGTNGTTGHCQGEPVNFAQDWERPANLKLQMPDGTEIFDVNAGVRIAGACSRGKPVKSLNIYLRESEYGDKKIDYPLFAARDHSDYRRLKLRNSGQDFVRMGFRDVLNQNLLLGQVDLDLQAGFPVIVFLNGEFWAMQNLRENFHGEYFESVFGVDEDDLDIIKSPGMSYADVKEGNDLAYNEFFDWLQESDLSTEADWDNFKSQVDWNEFTNYWIAMGYMSNYDWPANNLAVWRERKEGEKWRYLVTDTDGSTNNHLGGDAATSFNTLESITSSTSTNWPNHINSTLAFRSALEQPEFHDEYIQRTCSFINLIYTEQRVNHFVDSLKAMYDPYAQMHIDKWQGDEENVMGGDIYNWEHWIDEYRLFFVERPDYFRGFMEEVLDIDGTYNLTVDFDANSGGYVLINRNEMELPFQFEGIYMSDVPVRLTAIANDGFAFSHWLETGETNPVIDFLASNDETITPIFVTSCTPNAPDEDQDGICDLEDNCIETPNSDQADADNDGIGDTCDDCNANLAGTSCNDGDFCTTNDVYDADCNCQGTLEDSDNDGICDAMDPCDNNLEGTACNDNNECTTDDTFNAFCQCIGVFQDTDSDGICDADDDCNNTLEGMPCEDSDPCTINDTMDENCNCIGTFQDTDEDGICDADDDCDNNLIGTSCDDNDVCTIEDTYNENCDCVGTFADLDNDNICDAEDDCDNTTTGNPCNDGDLCTVNDLIDENCDCVGTFADSDGDGICNADDECDDNLIGAPCDDEDICTDNDVFDQNCNCAGTFLDADEDGICDAEDDCDADLIGMPCDDNDVCTIEDTFDTDCNCLGTFQDADEDGICDAEDDCDASIIGMPCEDNDPCTIEDTFDADCNCLGVFVDVDEDGVCAFDDCDDENSNLPAEVNTPCDDNDELTEEDVIQEDGCTCLGSLIDAVDDANISDFQIQLFPNPAHQILNVRIEELSSVSITQFKIFNTIGIQCHPNQSVFNNEFTIDVSTFSSGVYWLVLETENNERIVRSFLSENK